jgi:endonuclease/exonuclease/phosphatase family metal-dependent hydrolase
MSDGNRLNRQIETQAVGVALRHPLTALAVIGVLIVGAVAYYWWSNRPKHAEPPPVVGDGNPGSILLCAWNVENFFDDQDDPKVHDDMEDWFGTDPAAFRLKVDHLAEGLLKMNNGAGPDVACLCEVESDRCMKALQEAANAKLDAAGLGDRKYTATLFKGDNMGRHFAPGIMTRIGVTADRTRKLGKTHNGRLIEGHLHLNGHELIVIVAHWTSRVTDKEGQGGRRADYAQDIYGRVNEILHANADADVIVCGDFNDEFKDPSIQNDLHATDDPAAVRDSVKEPRLLDVMANWAAPSDPPGSIHGKGHWSVFDHICVARGLLDEKDWSCNPRTARVFAAKEMRHGKHGEPFAFGKKVHEGPRGYSDHFPVIVQLTVTGKD